MDPEKISHNSRVAEARSSAARSPFLWSLLLVLSVLGCSLFSSTWNTSHPLHLLAICTLIRNKQ